MVLKADQIRPYVRNVWEGDLNAKTGAAIRAMRYKRNERLRALMSEKPSLQCIREQMNTAAREDDLGAFLRSKRKLCISMMDDPDAIAILEECYSEEQNLQ